MQKRTVFVGLVVVLLVVGANSLSVAYQEKAEDRAGLTKAVAGAKVSFEQGLSAATREGKPISAKFEVEENKLHLSVYTAKGDKFSEVVVDHETGKVAKSEAIASGEDLTAAKAQSEAMSKAKRSLRDAVTQVLKVNAGFHAVSVFPSLKYGHPVAEITLAKGDKWKTVSEKLD
jgi:plasmid stability protein